MKQDFRKKLVSSTVAVMTYLVVAAADAQINDRVLVMSLIFAWHQLNPMRRMPAKIYQKMLTNSYWKA